MKKKKATALSLVILWYKAASFFVLVVVLIMILSFDSGISSECQPRAESTAKLLREVQSCVRFSRTAATLAQRFKSQVSSRAVGHRDGEI